MKLLVFDVFKVTKKLNQNSFKEDLLPMWSYILGRQKWKAHPQRGVQLSLWKSRRKQRWELLNVSIYSFHYIFHFIFYHSLTVPGGVETRYSCCESVVGSPGCQVFNVFRFLLMLGLKGWIIFAADSEMYMFTAPCPWCSKPSGLCEQSPSIPSGENMSGSLCCWHRNSKILVLTLHNTAEEISKIAFF